MLAALRTSESAGLQLRLAVESAERLTAARAPWRWPLRLNVLELAGLLGWPLGGEDLPGYAAVHPRRLPPAPGTAAAADRVASGARVIARSSLPTGQLLVQTARDALHHTAVTSPTGTGKSHFLASLICQDVQAGRSVVVIEPKGDLVADVLARVPGERIRDVVLLDPADRAPVGLNPLVAPDQSPELAADSVLGGWCFSRGVDRGSGAAP